MHASCESPWHSLAKRTRLGGLLPPQVAFQEHAAHPPRWPGDLSSKGSSDTCISDSVSTFLYRAFTAHGAHLVLIHPDLALAPFETRFNAQAGCDHPRQFCQRRRLELDFRHTRRREVIAIAVPAVLFRGIRRGLSLQDAVVRERTTGDHEPLLGSRSFAFQTSLHAACDHLNPNRPFLAVSHGEPPPRSRVERCAPLRHRLPRGFRSSSAPLILG